MASNTRYTPQQRDAAEAIRRETVEQMHDDLAAKLTTFDDRDAWQQWLKFASGFHQYSFSNTCLIYMAKPDATLVAGYRAWQAKGHQVRRGETAIKVFAPVTRIIPIEDANGKPVLDANGRQLTRRQMVGVKVASVFDALSRVLVRDSWLGSWIRLCLVRGAIASCRGGVELTGFRGRGRFARGAVDQMHSEVECVGQEVLDFAGFVGVAVDEEFGLGVAGEDVDGDGQGVDSASGRGADEHVDAFTVAAGGAVEVAVVDGVDHVGVAGVCRSGDAVNDDCRGVEQLVELVEDGAAGLAGSCHCYMLSRP